MCACGFGGCKAYAEAAASGSALRLMCPGGEETAKAVAEIFGKEVKAQARRRVAEGGLKPDVAHERYEYDGVPDCKFVTIMGGYKACHTLPGLGTVWKPAL